jgi:hypothetical protein
MTHYHFKKSAKMKIRTNATRRGSDPDLPEN